MVTYLLIHSERNSICKMKQHNLGTGVIEPALDKKILTTKVPYQMQHFKQTSCHPLNCSIRFICICRTGLPMTVIEENLFHKTEDDKFKDDPVECRQFPTKATATPLHQHESNVHERQPYDGEVEENPEQSGMQFLTIYLKTEEHNRQ